MKRSDWIAPSLVVFCAAALLSSPARPQAADPQPREQSSTVAEVVVTARRREESVQDVPISIVSKTAEYLQQAGVQSVTELARVVPGFIFNEFEAGQQSTAQIRGLSSFAFQTHAPQSVGIVIDDVVMGVIGQSMSEFNDVDRIEVLRGPQGTLFGRNTTGGVVHIVTNDPSDAFEAKISASYGSYNQVRWNGTINGALSENLDARASVFTSNRDGYIENVNDGRMLNSEQQVGGTTKLLYRPWEGTQFKLSTTYIERQREGISSGGGDPVVAFGPTATPESIAVNAGLVGPHNNKVNGVGFHPYDEKVGAASLTWNQTLGDFALTSITGFEYWRFEFGKDADFRTFNGPTEPLSLVRFFVPNQLHGWSQEVRLNSPKGQRFEYVLGVFASGMNLWERRHFLINIATDPDPAGAVYLFDLGDQNTYHADYAGFGESDFHLTSTLTLTAGARWTHDRTHVTLDGVGAPFFDPDLGVGIGPLGEVYIPFLDSEFPGHQHLTTSDSELTWRGGLRWEPTKDLMFYTSVARGFKGPTITALGALGPVKSEIDTSYEVGTKADWLSHRVTTSLTVFHADVSDLQSQGVDSIDTPRGPVGSIFLTNAAKVRSEGVEFELSAAPADKLNLNFGLAYTDAKFVSYPEAACFSGQTLEEGCTGDEVSRQDLSGRQMPLVPKWSGNAAATYDFTLPFWNGKHFVRLDYTYRDRINWDLGLAPLTESDAVGIWGLTLGLRSADERLEIVAAVKNLTDEFVVNDLSGGSGTIQANLLPEYQRTWDVTLNYKFR